MGWRQSLYTTRWLPPPTPTASESIHLARNSDQSRCELGQAGEFLHAHSFLTSVEHPLAKGGFETYTVRAPSARRALYKAIGTQAAGSDPGGLALGTTGPIAEHRCWLLCRIGFSSSY